MKLSDMKVGETVIIREVKTTGAMKRRLMDMGVMKNVKVSLKKKAPMGDPIEVVLRGYHLSLRKTEAETIIVEKM